MLEEKVTKKRFFWGGIECTHPVLRMSGCTLYSLAKTKGTIPCGRAAWFLLSYPNKRKVGEDKVEVMLVLHKCTCLLHMINSSNQYKLLFPCAIFLVK